MSNIAKKVESSLSYHRDCPPFAMAESDIHHGGKKSVVRNGLAQSVSRLSVGGKVVFER